MKCVIFKGVASFNLRGDWGCITIEGNGVINRVNENAWNLAKKKYASLIEDFVSKGLIEESNTKDNNKYRDDDAESDAKKDAQSEQDKKVNPNLLMEDQAVKEDEKSKHRLGLEAKALELGISFDDKTSSTELKTKIREKMGR